MDAGELHTVITGLVISIVAGLVLFFGVRIFVHRHTVAAPEPPPEPTDPAALWEYRFGPINPALICPHCQTKGRVHARRISVAAGISAEKATAAVLTGGYSVLATGLSRTADRTQAACEACSSVWQF
ncbi:MAG TPA: hypothetical protein VIE43_06640 [Thermoanaerobaculia bacterium]|jgi:hypothetical protein|nr:hypothetical protein [Thermoanaerobaculia bacterium]